MQGTFKERVAQVLAGDYPQRDRVPVCATPKLIQEVGFSGQIIVMEQDKLRACLAPESTATLNENHHDLPIDFMDNLPQYVENPAMILSSLTKSNSIVLVTDCKDKRDCPIIIALSDSGKRNIVDGEIVTYNKLASVYGKDGFTSFLNRSLQNNGLLFYNEKKSRDLAVSAGLQLPGVLANHNSNTIIRRYDDNVNPFSQNYLDFSPDGYGNTLYRPDGQPFAYSDPDGRQKIFEYTKTLNGKDVLRSTTTTFSDGRSEITEYDDHGTITGIIRKDVHGRTTYKYSSDGMGYYDREESIGYFNADPRYSSEPNAHKSEHIKEHTKEEQRGIYYDKYKEDWREYNGDDRLTLFKHNEYRDDGITPEKYYSVDRRYEYDRYGNCTLSVDKDHDGTAIDKREYYASQEWYDFYNLTPEDTDGECERPLKSRISLLTDGRIRFEQYKISGEHTELEFSPDGKLSEFRDTNGVRHSGQAAAQAYAKSVGGSVPTFAEVVAATKTSRPAAAANNTKKNNGKPTGNGSGSSGR